MNGRHRLPERDITGDITEVIEQDCVLDPFTILGRLQTLPKAFVWTHMCIDDCDLLQ